MANAFMASLLKWNRGGLLTDVVSKALMRGQDGFADMVNTPALVTRLPAVL
jgi:hypothetical protein